MALSPAGAATACVLLHFVAAVTGRTERVLASPDIPITAFSCTGRHVGYYADLETNCQVYHMCGDGERQYSYMCPNTTLFHQRMLICAHWYQVNCSRSEQDYAANLLIGQRDKPFVPDYFTGLGEDGVEVDSGIDLQHLAQRRLGTAFHTTAREEPEDLQIASSGSLLDGSQNSVRGADGKERPTTPSSVTSRPTNVSFRSTIETPSSDPKLARTQPMTRPPRPTLRTIIRPRVPSVDLEPPERGLVEETNTLELRLEDPRRAFFIPEDGSQVPRVDPILVRIRVTGESRLGGSQRLETAARDCQQCHPLFLIDKENCSPCVRLS